MLPAAPLETLPMMARIVRIIIAAAFVSFIPPTALAQRPRVFLPEARSLPEPQGVREPVLAPRHGGPPATVRDPLPVLRERPIGLHDCLREAILHSNVVRLLSATGSARAAVTIYDPAIALAEVDRAQARFDPQVVLRQNWRRFETPSAVPDPVDPSRSLIVGSRTDDYDVFADVSKRNLLGGLGGVRAGATPTRFPGQILPLNPQSRSFAELHYTQPLLQGAGWAVNQAPIILARIDTQRSYFQLKDALQEMVRGVIVAYWDLVSARVEVFARRKQVEQAEAALTYTKARKESGFGDLGDVAQAQLALANFRASLIAAEANLLDREAALRAILNMPPASQEQLAPVTPPQTQRIRFRWEELLAVAEQERPDIIELKLILEADRQRLLQARNQMLPQLDAVALYRWNGLEGVMPVGDRLRADAGDHTSWTLGINFSVPLTLRRERAQVRQQELLIQKDRAFLQQGLHNMTHQIAAVLRRLESAYAQYRAFQETRKAAELNLRIQAAEFRAGRTILLNVLQAIANFGDALSSEARALADYNAQLANLERQTGTILETHGIRLFEERFQSLGPLVRLGRGRSYPQTLRPSDPVDRYPASDVPLDRQYQEQYPVRPESLMAPENPRALAPPRPAPAPTP